MSYRENLTAINEKQEAAVLLYNMIHRYGAPDFTVSERKDDLDLFAENIRELQSRGGDAEVATAINLHMQGLEPRITAQQISLARKNLLKSYLLLGDISQLTPEEQVKLLENVKDRYQHIRYRYDEIANSHGISHAYDNMPEINSASYRAIHFMQATGLSGEFNKEELVNTILASYEEAIIRSAKEFNDDPSYENFNEVTWAIKIFETFSNDSGVDHTTKIEALLGKPKDQFLEESDQLAEQRMINENNADVIRTLRSYAGIDYSAECKKGYGGIEEAADDFEKQMHRVYRNGFNAQRVPHTLRDKHSQNTFPDPERYNQEITILALKEKLDERLAALKETAQEGGFLGFISNPIDYAFISEEELSACRPVSFSNAKPAKLEVRH